MSPKMILSGDVSQLPNCTDFFIQILENKNLFQIKAKHVCSVQSGPNDNDIGLIISGVSTKSRSNFSLAGF